MARENGRGWGALFSWIIPVTRTGFRQQMTFGRAMAMGVVASVAVAVIRLIVLHSLFAHRPIVGGLTYPRVVTWAVLSGMLFTVLWPPWAHDFPESIRSGVVVRDLLKPANAFLYQLAMQGGRLLALILIRVLPLTVFAAFVLRVPSPHGVLGWACLGASLVLFLVACVTYVYMLGCIAFFTSDYHHWLAFAFYVVQLLGGVLVPVEFIPGVGGTLIRWGPGMAFMASPTRIINDIAPVQTLLIQTFWTAVFCFGAYYALHFGRKKLVIYGG